MIIRRVRMYLIEFKMIYKKVIMNGKKLDYYHLSNGTIDPLKKLPSTDVYKFVESFLEKRD